MRVSVDKEQTWIGERLARLHASLSDDERLEMARALAHACRMRVEQHDPYTKEHSVRVARWARVIASRLPTFDRRRLDRLEITALVHDFGKIYVPRAILNKPGHLADAEFAQVQKHPVHGAQLLENFREFVEMDGVLYHHVRYEGGGYPDGSHFRGSQIPIEARIIAVADTFDALTSDRSYRKGMPPVQAFEVLRREAGRQLDPTLVRVFQDYYKDQALARGYTPGAKTIELSATLDEEVRRALAFLRTHKGSAVDWRDPLNGMEDRGAFVESAIEHLVSLTIDRPCAELFVRSAYNLPLDESFSPEDIEGLDDTPHAVDYARPGHRELIITLREMKPRYESLTIAVYDGKLWKCVADGRRMVLLR